MGGVFTGMTNFLSCARVRNLMGKKVLVRENELLRSGGLLSFPRTGRALRAFGDLITRKEQSALRSHQSCRARKRPARPQRAVGLCAMPLEEVTSRNSKCCLMRHPELLDERGGEDVRTPLHRPSSATARRPSSCCSSAASSQHPLRR